MRLLLVRHGATANNLEARYTGQSDIPLTPLGERQAATVAQRLAHEPLDCIVSSDLQRARRTADAIATYHPSAPRHEDPDLREINFGDWEGLTHTQVLAQYPDHATRWEADSVRHAPPGGETIATFTDRLTRALERWRAAYPDGTVLWATHGGVIGALLCHLLGMDQRRRWQFRRDNTAISSLDIGLAIPSASSPPSASATPQTAPDLYAIIMYLNDTAHLANLPGEADAEARQVI